MMGRNVFTDPTAVLPAYSWQVNHDTEEQAGKTRNVAEAANTSGKGLNKQQGDDGPLRFEFSGSFFHRAQLVTMLQYYEACNTRTIRFTDYAGDQYEVLITSFQPLRKRTEKNPRDFPNAPLWYWTYKITLEVVTIIAGPYHDAGVTP